MGEGLFYGINKLARKRARIHAFGGSCLFQQPAAI